MKCKFIKGSGKKCKKKAAVATTNGEVAYCKVHAKKHIIYNHKRDAKNK